jgi:hypothetical protein
MLQKRQSPVNIEAVKKTNSILTGDIICCYIYAVYAVKRTNSILTGDWLFATFMH